MATAAVRRSPRLLASSSPATGVQAQGNRNAVVSSPRWKKSRRKDKCEPDDGGGSGPPPRKRLNPVEVEDGGGAGEFQPLSPAQTAVSNGRRFKVLPSRSIEAELWQLGFKRVAGVDEAGRGPLAGPVVAAACIIPSTVMIQGVDDSKKLTEKRREELFSEIISIPGVSYALQVVNAATIDDINILQATMQAMNGCLEQLGYGTNDAAAPDYVLVDGTQMPEGWSTNNARPVVRGDAESFVIAAASILAKVTRDRLMADYDKMWPVYQFKYNKGYGTAAHIAALRKHGPCEIHRRSFAPLRSSLRSPDS